MFVDLPRPYHRQIEATFAVGQKVGEKLVKVPKTSAKVAFFGLIFDRNGRFGDKPFSSEMQGPQIGIG